MHVSVDGAVVDITAGMDPAFNAVSRAAKRLVPPNDVTGEGGIPVNMIESTMPWWDNMVYKWRGNLCADISRASLVISHTIATAIESHLPRMQADLNARVIFSPDRHMQVTLWDVNANVFVPHDERSGRIGADMLEVCSKR